ncbi:unnamed protein product [Mycena citricolor]|uniref:Uncharacterized protein n=1 Tax=Mycena citricolor TaxID=2018698 RepID=A0AAD2Q256_9AGAR|nr:unnamed protein product [Mycena citricolor]
MALSNVDDFLPKNVCLNQPTVLFGKVCRPTSSQDGAIFAHHRSHGREPPFRGCVNMRFWRSVCVSCDVLLHSYRVDCVGNVFNALLLRFAPPKPPSRPMEMQNRPETNHLRFSIGSWALGERVDRHVLSVKDLAAQLEYAERVPNLEGGSAHGKPWQLSHTSGYTPFQEI